MKCVDDHSNSKMFKSHSVSRTFITIIKTTVSLQQYIDYLLI